MAMEMMKTSPLTRPPKLCDILVKELQEFLHSEQLPSGARLPPERILCERFQVSRTVMREAIGILVAQGTLKQIGGKGTFVSHDIAGPLANAFNAFARRSVPRGPAELFEVRSMLEVEVAGLAAVRATEEEIAGLVKLNRSLEALHRQVGLSSNEIAHYNQLDLDFHIALAKCTHNKFFVVLITALSESFKNSWSDSHRKSEVRRHGIEMHAKILGAIQNRDPVAARQATRNNLAAFLADTQGRSKKS